jgi:hypothetical protein
MLPWVRLKVLLGGTKRGWVAPLVIFALACHTAIADYGGGRVRTAVHLLRDAPHHAVVSILSRPIVCHDLLSYGVKTAPASHRHTACT